LVDSRKELIIPRFDLGVSAPVLAGAGGGADEDALDEDDDGAAGEATAAAAEGCGSSRIPDPTPERAATKRLPPDAPPPKDLSPFFGLT
jgi:hypothetical protein